MNDEPLLREYYEIVKIVGEFDARLLTVKGWGVTLSLAALAWGFQYRHYGLFFVASLSGLGFWLIEGTMKRHQMRHYFRMREIEVLGYEAADEQAQAFSSPRIDSGWSHAARIYLGKATSEYRPKSMNGPRNSYRLVWFLPQVFLPHLVSVLAGLILLLLGRRGALGEMMW